MRPKIFAGLALLAAGTAMGLAAEPVELTVHTGKAIKTIDKRIYGQFLEHIFNSVHGGLWGDQVLNGTLELRPVAASAPGVTATAPATAPGANPPRYWEFFGEPNVVSNDAVNPFNAQSSVHIE